MKYIIEFEDEPFMREDGVNYYTCKSVSWFKLGDTIINRLEPYTEPDRKAVDLQYARDIENVARMNYNEGTKDAWDFAKAINYMGYDDFVSCFGGKTEEAVYELSYSEVKAEYEAWKRTKEEIRVGDEVTDNDLDDIGVVTYVDDSCYCILWSSGVVSEDVRKSELRSTGRHFNITHELLKKMKEGDRT